MQDSDFRCKTWHYGASRAHPNATVDWSQFEPLVGIPAVDPRDVTPYAEHWMVSVERQFGRGVSGHGELCGRGLAPPAGAGGGQPGRSRALPQSRLGLRAVQRAGRAHQFGPAFGSVELQRTIANANYNAFEATLNHRSHGLDMLASYTWSKSIDQSAGLPEPVNPIDPSLSRGLSSFDMRHNLVTSFHYQLPALRAKGLLHTMDPVGRSRELRALHRGCR